MSDTPAIIVFDGVCRLCNASLRFVDRRDVRGKFVYLPIESEAGRRVCARFGVDPDDPDSFVLLDEGDLYLKTAAWSAVLRGLRIPWSWTGYLLGLVPARLADPVYDFVGRNRYRWFGRFDACPWPPDDDARRATDAQVEAALGAGRD